MSQFIALLTGLVELINKLLRKKEQANHEDQAADIEESPSTWFYNHFDDPNNRLRDELPDAAQADQTSIGSQRNR